VRATKSAPPRSPGATHIVGNIEPGITRSDTLIIVDDCVLKVSRDHAVFGHVGDCWRTKVWWLIDHAGKSASPGAVPDAISSWKTLGLMTVVVKIRHGCAEAGVGARARRVGHDLVGLVVGAEVFWLCLVSPQALFCAVETKADDVLVTPLLALDVRAVGRR